MTLASVRSGRLEAAMATSLRIARRSEESISAVSLTISALRAASGSVALKVLGRIVARIGRTLDVRYSKALPA